MKNLHLLPMDSTFNDGIVSMLNANFPLEENVFVLRSTRSALAGNPNCIVNAAAFSPEYINEHACEYRRIILHSLYMSPKQLLQLSDEAARRITWIVWGHDLYTVKKKEKRTISNQLDSGIHFCKKILRGTLFREWKTRKAVRKKVCGFHSIGIGYPYDEHMIRKKFGKKVSVVYGPVIGHSSIDQIRCLRAEKSNKRLSVRLTEPIRIMVGHSGYDFLEHEKYLRKLAAYKDENICIYMVLCYGASPEKIEYLTDLAINIFGSDKVHVQTEMLSREAYNSFLSKIDIAIFPYRHQSGLGNTKRLAYMGTKLYLDPRGVLAKGFFEGGIKTYDCRKIGRLSFSEFSKATEPPDEFAPLFRSYNSPNNELGISAWRNILTDS